MFECNGYSHANQEAMMDIIEKLEDLLRQATTEHSHFYVAQTCREAIHEIKVMQAKITAVHAIADEGEASTDATAWGEIVRICEAKA